MKFKPPGVLAALFALAICLGGCSRISIVIEQKIGLSAPWSDHLMSEASPNIPIGWGYMDPMVVAIGSDFYAPVFYPRDAEKRSVYCTRVYKNGVESVTADALVLGSGGGDTPAASYQPPMIFLSPDKLLIAIAWSLDQSGVSTLSAYGVDLKASSPRAWKLLARIKSPDQIINYAGGAMARDGSIYVVAAGSSPSEHSLELLKLAAPYMRFEGPQTVVSYAMQAYEPLYSHVVVRNDGTLSILATFQNGTPCSETGMVLTAYKGAALFDGAWGGSFNMVWSDFAADSAASPATNGDSCYWRDSRFAYDLIYNPADNKVYSITKSTDITDRNAAAKLASNQSYNQKFVLRADGSVINADLSFAFANVFPNLKDIEVMSMTRLDSGRLVIFAHNRNEVLGTPTQIGIVSTRDFVHFSPAYRLETAFGPGHSVKVAQGFKNTVWGVDALFFVHSGRLNADTSRTNEHLQFSFVKGKVLR